MYIQVWQQASTIHHLYLVFRVGIWVWGLGALSSFRGSSLLAVEAQLAEVLAELCRGNSAGASSRLRLGLRLRLALRTVLVHPADSDLP